MYYPPVLLIHSWLRWATLLLAIAATVNAFRTDSDLSRPMPGRQWDTLFMMALDFQVLFGLLLYFGLSPFTMEASKDLGSVVANTGLRLDDRPPRLDGRSHGAGTHRTGTSAQCEDVPGAPQVARAILHADDDHHPRGHSMAGARLRTTVFRFW